MKRKYPIFILPILLTLLLPVRVNAGSPAALIEAVNAYRSANGLATYGLDGALMSAAQSHSEYMASIKTCTHQRADGSGPGAHGISAENVACGINLSVDTAIYVHWVDPVHSATILGPDTGLVGAGMAVAGDRVFYTLAVKRLSGDFTYRPPVMNTQPSTPAPGQTIQPSLTPDPLLAAAGPLLAATPQADGTLKHTIRYGQTLIAIAKIYGLSLDALLALNTNLDAKNPVYYEGQVLVIRLPFTPTATASQTLTPRPPTRTPTRTATPVLSPTPTPTATATPWLRLPDGQGAGLNRPTLAYIVIIASAVGILVVLLRGFLKSKK